MENKSFRSGDIIDDLFDELKKYAVKRLELSEEEIKVSLSPWDEGKYNKIYSICFGGKDWLLSYLQPPTKRPERIYNFRRIAAVKLKNNKKSEEKLKKIFRKAVTTGGISLIYEYPTGRIKSSFKPMNDRLKKLDREETINNCWYSEYEEFGYPVSNEFDIPVNYTEEMKQKVFTGARETLGKKA